MQPTSEPPTEPIVASSDASAPLINPIVRNYNRSPSRGSIDAGTLNATTSLGPRTDSVSGDSRTPTNAQRTPSSSPSLSSIDEAAGSGGVNAPSGEGLGMLSPSGKQAPRPVFRNPTSEPLTPPQSSGSAQMPPMAPKGPASEPSVQSQSLSQSQPQELLRAAPSPSRPTTSLAVHPSTSSFVSRDASYTTSSAASLTSLTTATAALSGGTVNAVGGGGAPLSSGGSGGSVDLVNAPTQSLPQPSESVQSSPSQTTPLPALPSQSTPTSTQTPTRAVQSAPSQASPAPSDKVQAVPSQASPVQGVPSQTTPSHGVPTQTTPTRAVQAVPSQEASPAQGKAQAVPAEASPVQAVPAHTSPVPSDKVQSALSQASPMQSVPAHTSPVQSDGQSPSRADRSADGSSRRPANADSERSSDADARRRQPAASPSSPRTPSGAIRQAESLPCDGVCSAPSGAESAQRAQSLSAQSPGRAAVSDAGTPAVASATRCVPRAGAECASPHSHADDDMDGCEAEGWGEEDEGAADNTNESVVRDQAGSTKDAHARTLTPNTPSRDTESRVAKGGNASPQRAAPQGAGSASPSSKLGSDAPARGPPPADETPKRVRAEDAQPGDMLASDSATSADDEELRSGDESAGQCSAQPEAVVEELGREAEEALLQEEYGEGHLEQVVREIEREEAETEMRTHLHPPMSPTPTVIPFVMKMRPSQTRQLSPGGTTLRKVAVSEVLLPSDHEGWAEARKVEGIVEEEKSAMSRALTSAAARVSGLVNKVMGGATEKPERWMGSDDSEVEPEQLELEPSVSGPGPAYFGLGAEPSAGPQRGSQGDAALSSTSSVA